MRTNQELNDALLNFFDLRLNDIIITLLYQISQMKCIFLLTYLYLIDQSLKIIKKLRSTRTDATDQSVRYGLRFPAKVKSLIPRIHNLPAVIL